MNALQVLEGARARITNSSKWIKYAYARDAEGISCDELSSNAVCFCSVGAVRNAAYTYDSHEYMMAMQALYVVMGVPVRYYNDHHTHDEVLAKFDEAIEQLRAVQ